MQEGLVASCCWTWAVQVQILAAARGPLRAHALARRPSSLSLVSSAASLHVAASAVTALVLHPFHRLVRWEMNERKDPNGSPEYNG